MPTNIKFKNDININMRELAYAGGWSQLDAKDDHDVHCSGLEIFFQ